MVLPTLDMRWPEIRLPLFCFLTVCFLAGAAAGAFYGNEAGAAALPAEYLNDARRGAADFVGCAVKYGKWLAALAILAAAPPLSLLCPAIIFARGFALGLGTAALAQMAGLTGLWYAALLYGPQNALLTPVYLLAAYAGVSALRRGGGRFGKGAVLPAALAVGLAAAFEACATPVLAALLIG